MRESCVSAVGWFVVLFATGVVGCTTVDSDKATLASNSALRGVQSPGNSTLPPHQDPSLQQVSSLPDSGAAQNASILMLESTPFGRDSELSVEALEQQVLARNPSLAEMVAAWQAASARYPQATSLDDPMLEASFGPGSIGSSSVNFAYKLQISQKLPFPGKRALRGEQALAEAAATGFEVEDMRLQLVQAAKNAFYDYYLVDRNQEVNEDNLKRLKEAKENAEARVANNLAPQQDILQADVEIARQQERQLQLRRIRQVTIARINSLVHLSPDQSLPRPPKQLPMVPTVVEVQRLRATALTRRPDVQALGNRLTADKATLALACKAFRPDFEVMASYDAFWQEPPLRTMVGVGMNLPVQRTRRHAAVAEAQARIAQRQAELDRLTDTVSFQVQEAYEQMRESEQMISLYEKVIPKAAEANVKEAISAYATGKVAFLSVIEAQRTLIGLRDRYYESVADYFRRRAMLERAIGEPLTTEK